MAKRTYTGKIVGGKLEIHDSRRKQMAQDVARMKEGALVVVEIRYAGKRSLAQNAFYWGVVIDIMRRSLNDLGHDVDDELTHEFLKSKFNTKPLISAEGEVIGELPGSTTEMNKDEFSVYYEKIKQWSMDVLNVYIPDPNEQVTLNF